MLDMTAHCQSCGLVKDLFVLQIIVFLRIQIRFTEELPTFKNLIGLQVPTFVTYQYGTAEILSHTEHTVNEYFLAVVQKLIAKNRFYSEP